MQQSEFFFDANEQAVDLLKHLISIPSISRDEKAAADFLENFLIAEGYETNRKGNNLWLLSPAFDTAKPTILLNSHIDTVKPVADWKREPFTPVVENGKLYGLGSNDAGASLVSLLFAYFKLIAVQQPYNLIFAASAEEEISGENGMRCLLNELPEIDFAVVGEPTEMQVAIAEKGLMVLDCVARGRAGHAARNEGENALYKAITDIEWFRSFEFEKKSALLGAVKMSVTQIAAGTQHNVIPDRCTFVVDIRSNELYTNEEILQIVRQNVSCEVTPRSVRLNSSKTPENHPFLLRAKDLCLQFFGSPTLSDQSLMPFPSVKIGVGASSRSHTADEFIFIEEINKAIDLYFKLLNGLIIS
ncbi:MAG: M20 family metallo-hydrolase [Paludibacter sp.]|jgi:acetylornithine deacetylase|nr:M20 family metallo-hydrolase [Paludibacter sp.]